MRTAPILAFLLFLAMASCNNPRKADSDSMKTDTTGSDPSGKPAEPTGLEDCFRSTTGNSVVEMAITSTGDSVYGTLNYLPEAKDKNTGTITGQWRGDTLLADYTFMSEGMESVREVVFLKTTEGFKEGYGPVKDMNGKMLFEDVRTADFSKSVPLIRVDCNKGKL